jgi:hypothetical protein
MHDNTIVVTCEELGKKRSRHYNLNLVGLVKPRSLLGKGEREDDGYENHQARE